MFRNRTLRDVIVGAAALTMITAGASLALARQSGGTKPDRPVAAPPAESVIAVGKRAPAFELLDTEGKTYTLKQHRGRIVVLEWFNPACPEVRHQHTDGSIKVLLPEIEAESVAWVVINSTPAGREGSGREALAKARTELGIRFPILLDEDGAVAKRYEVKRTPTVFLIDKEGVLRYFGAIDNAPNGKLPEGATKEEYLWDAMQAVIYDFELTTTKSEPYGCPIEPEASR
jgi:peroxiredoxin